MRLLYGVLLVVLAACGSGSPSSPGGYQPPASAPVVHVSMTDNGGLTPYAFAPESLAVKVGTAVQWTNSGKAQHTTTSDAAQPVWNSGTVQPAGSETCDPATDPYCTPGTSPAGSYQRTFNATGTYRYHCTVHGAQGMTGVIVVTP